MHAKAAGQVFQVDASTNGCNHAAVIATTAHADKCRVWQSQQNLGLPCIC